MTAAPDTPARCCWGLFRRATGWLPTWRGWLVIVLAGAGVTLGIGSQAHSFLSLNQPERGGVLAVEGWMPDYAMEAVIREVRQHPYAKVYVTGCPLDKGSYLSEYKSYADLGAATLLRLGLNESLVQAVPAPPTRANRTYASAVALRKWLTEHGVAATRFHVISIGPHARRTRLLFALALGPKATVGITALEDQSYDARRWWRSSEGVRTVIGETLAWAYAKLLFHPQTAE